MGRNELQQMDASSKTRADLMLLTDLFWAANRTANTFSRRITKTGQSCSIIPFADNRTIFGTIFLSFFLFKKKRFGFFIAHEFQQSRRQKIQIQEKVERRHTLFKRKVEVLWANVRPRCRCCWLLRTGRSARPEPICMRAPQEPPGDVRILLYCTNSEDGGNVLFRLE